MAALMDKVLPRSHRADKNFTNRAVRVDSDHIWDVYSHHEV